MKYKSLNFRILFLSMVMMTGLAPVMLHSQTATPPADGDGSIGGPYEIATLENLYWLSQNSGEWDKHFIQTADIDALDTETWDDGDGGDPEGFSPIGNTSIQFTGRYNGDGYTITGLFINRPATDLVAFFGIILPGSMIENVGLLGVEITGKNNTGGLAGLNSDGMITNCYVSGNISGDNSIGGLVGGNSSNIIDSFSAGNVSGTSYVGGLAGYNNTSIIRCYSTSNVNGTGDYIGGLAGQSFGSIEDSYAIGSVEGSDKIGGLVGTSEGGSIFRSYAIGSVTGSTNVGGFTGDLENGTYDANYWNTETSGQTDGIGSGSSSEVTGLTTAEMQDQASFDGWDFENIWDIGTNEGLSYPYLQNNFQSPPPGHFRAFITTWVTTDGEITIPTTGGGYNYDISWTNLTNAGVGDGAVTGETGNYTISGLENGSTYQVAISGDFPRIYFNNTGDKDKILTVEQWGDMSWTSMDFAFSGCTNLTIPATDSPDLSNVTNMNYMFLNATSFNQDISDWEVGNVTNMNSMFRNASSFNQDISNWDVSNVTNMVAMFQNASSFNQPLNDWNVSNVSTFCEHAEAMFLGATSFNQPIADWDVSNATNMDFMFQGATAFNQDLGSWNVSNITSMTGMLPTGGLSTQNYDNTLIGWAAQTVQSDVHLSASGLSYCNSVDARDELINTHGWTITGDAKECGFITTWVTTDGEITIPTTGGGYNYDISWTNLTNPGTGDGSASGQGGNYTISGLENGSTYQLEITGDFPRIYLNNTGDKDKILTVEQWGDITWTSMELAFFGCSNLTIPATDAPDLSNVTSMSGMFGYATSLNQDIGDWDLSSVTHMAQLFIGASSFNQDISTWNVGNVTNMNTMFGEATSFNQDLGSWDVGNVNDMTGMLDNSGLSNQNYDNTLTGWAAQTLQSGVPLGASGLVYCGEAARATLTEAPNSWTITGDIMACFPGGNGTEGDPFQIETNEHLNEVRNYIDSHFILMNDLDLTMATSDPSGEFWNEGAGWEQIGTYSTPFTGQLDGQGYTITGLTIDRDSEYRLGLFGVTGGSALIENVHLNGVNIIGGSTIGGMVGENISATFFGCSVSGNVSGSSSVGGFAGALSGTLTNCFVLIEVNATGDNAGGIVGGSSGTINTSYSAGVVNGNNYVGGIFGSSDRVNLIANCYSVANISGNQYVGGLVGFLNGGPEKGTIENSYATGSISENSDAGGLVGLNQGIVTGSFWNTETSCQSEGNEGVGKTTAELLLESTFTDWDFETRWSIEENTGYPYHQWQGIMGEHNEPIEIPGPTVDVEILPDLTGDCEVDAPEAPTASSYCGESIEGVTDAVFPLTESTTITWIFEDGSGKTETQTQNVVIEDVSAPAPDEESLVDLIGECSVEMPASPTATDNCDGLIEGVADLDFPLTESTTITWTFEDATGNTSTQTQEVVIEDTTDPVPDVADLMDLTGECMVEAPVAPTATDNCDGQITGTTDAVFPLMESAMIIWTFEDATGNNATQTQNVVIEDVTAPVADTESLEDLIGECSVAMPNTPTATDNCDGAITGVADVTFPLSESTTITWTFEDGTGNITTQTQNVVIEDMTDPVPNLEMLADLTSECSVAMPVAPMATDNCDGVIEGVSDVEFPLTESATVTWTFEDATGNTATQTQEVVIEDTADPVPDVADLTDLTGECMVEAPVAPTATDNCDGQITGTTDAEFPLMESAMIIWTFEDAVGNNTTQTQNVVIEDVTAPVADTESLEDLIGECSVAMPNTPTATDNCDGAITGVVDVTFPLSESTTITWTFEDESGNISTQTQNIVIEDTTDPVPDAESLTDLTGDCSVAMPTVPTASDDCDGIIQGVSDTSFPITESGTTEVTWTFEDSNGNAVSQTQNITVTSLDNSVTQNGNLLRANANGVNYQWVNCDEGNAPVSGATSKTFRPDDNGNYAVEISNENCTVTSDCFAVTVLGLPDGHSLGLYPNPVVETLNIRNENSKEIQVRILDTTGKQLFMRRTRSVLFSIDMTSYTTGIYFVSLVSEGSALMEKIIKGD